MKQLINASNILRIYISKPRQNYDGVNEEKDYICMMEVVLNLTIYKYLKLGFFVTKRSSVKLSRTSLRLMS